MSSDKRLALQRIFRSLKLAIESRIFCSTGAGGGVDSSCSPKDKGGGGWKEKPASSLFPGEEKLAGKMKAEFDKKKADKELSDEYDAFANFVDDGGFDGYMGIQPTSGKGKGKGKSYKSDKAKAKSKAKAIAAEDKAQKKADAAAKKAVDDLEKSLSKLEGSPPPRRKGKRSARPAAESRIFCSTGAGGGIDSSCSPKDKGGGEMATPAEMSGVAQSARKDLIEATGMKSPSSAKKGQVDKYMSPDRSKTFHSVDFVPPGVDVDSSQSVAWKAASARLKAAGWKIKDGAVAPGSYSKKASSAVASKKQKDGSTLTITINKAAWEDTGSFVAFVAPPEGKKPITESKKDVGDYSQFRRPDGLTDKQASAYAKTGKLPKGYKGGGKKKRSAVPAVESRSLPVERRCFAVESAVAGEPSLRVESRCENGGTNKREYIVGYAAKFGVNSLDLGKFTERIAPSAFGLVTERRGRKKPLETRALFNHNADMPLAKHPGTLKLSVDDVGLRYEFPVPDTTYGRDLASNIRNGIVTGSSFSFTVPKDGEEWSMEEGRSIRTVTRVDSLIDVGPVTYPAYPDTDAMVAQRSYERFIEEIESRIFCSTGEGGGVDSSCSPKDKGGGGDKKDVIAKAGDKITFVKGTKSGAGEPAPKDQPASKFPGEEERDAIDAALEAVGDDNAVKASESKLLETPDVRPPAPADVERYIKAVEKVRDSDPDTHEKARKSAIADAMDEGFSPEDYDALPDKIVVYRIAREDGEDSGDASVFAMDRKVIEQMIDDFDNGVPGGYHVGTFKVNKSDIVHILPNAEDDWQPGVVVKAGGVAAKKAPKSSKKSRSLFAKREQAVKKARLLRRSITRLAFADLKAFLAKHGR